MPSDDQPPAWIHLLRRDKRGRIIPDVETVVIALRNAPELKNAFAFDVFRQRVMVMRELPRAPSRTSKKT
jgi:hypothetical protein